MSTTTIKWSSPDVLYASEQYAVCDAIIAALGGHPDTSTAHSAHSGEWTITVCQAEEPEPPSPTREPAPCSVIDAVLGPRSGGVS